MLYGVRSQLHLENSNLDIVLNFQFIAYLISTNLQLSGVNLETLVQTREILSTGTGTPNTPNFAKRSQQFLGKIRRSLVLLRKEYVLS